MLFKQLEQSELSVIARILGALFYYQPKDYVDANIDTLLQTLDTSIEPLNLLMAAFSDTNIEVLQLEHDRLFTGLGEMPAPPWGSTYLDKEEVVFGDSTIEYRRFLQRCGLKFESKQDEPEDQIGLMLMVLSILLEADDTALISEMLNQHLMTWFPMYVERFECTVELPAYLQAVQLTKLLLNELCLKF